MGHQMPISITSDTTIEIDAHFKVIAGPGAGKTYWLIKQIKKILRNSNQLGAGSKIACISYTNAAAEEIIKGLNTPEDIVEVSTIHSFLYANVIKPYVYMLKDETGRDLVDAKSLRGHDEHVPEYPKITNFIKEIAKESGKASNVYPKKVTETKEALKRIICTINPDDECVFTTQSLQSPNRTNIPFFPCDKLVEYKSQYWAEGKLDHNDVLYLSHKIFKENPEVIKFISAKYPYILLDEFQDTNPVQTKIVRDLSRCGTFIGIVGDPAQSIYSFIGANRRDFLDFHLEGIKVYTIEGNRRSTPNIISLLNHIRQGDEFLPGQKAVPDTKHPGPVSELIFSEDINKILKYFKRMIGANEESSCCVLSRKNKSLSSLRLSSHSQTWEKLQEIDKGRYFFLKKLILGMRYAENEDYFRAIGSIETTLLTDVEGKCKNATIKGNIIGGAFKTRQLAVSITHYLIDTEYEDMSLMEFYTNLNEYLKDQFGLSLKGVRKGKFKDIAMKSNLNDLYQSLELQDNASRVKTIHKAKGTERDSVLVIFDKISDLEKHLLKPDINSEDDECRVIYVALSRAKTHLFLGVLTRTPVDQAKFQKICGCLKIVNLDQATLDPAFPEYITSQVI
jgi:DNA helicase-2/ATP-dependent DNA helicase PcrA